MTDLFAIDYGPLEDLMFWNRFARLLKARGADAPPALILLGSGERAHGLMGGPGAAPRSGGELPSHADSADRLERGMREELQSVVATLTDEGISTAGFSGLDRKLLRFTEKGNSDIQTNETRPQVGERALASAMKWTDQGVVPVISCLAGEADGGYRDTHPAVAAWSVADALTDARIILVAQRLTDALRALRAGTGNNDIDHFDVADALAEPAILDRLPRRTPPVHVTHADLGDLRSAPRIVLA